MTCQLSQPQQLQLRGRMIRLLRHPAYNLHQNQSAGVRKLNFPALSVEAKSKAPHDFKLSRANTYHRLKCDRNQPCRSCVGRGTAHTCTYIQNTSRSRSTAARSSQNTQSSNIQNKISQLEDMVVSLMAKVLASKGVQQPPELKNDTKEKMQLEVMEFESDNPESLADNFGRITLENTGTKYVDNAHWTAILDGVSVLSSRNFTISSCSSVVNLYFLCMAFLCHLFSFRL